MKIAVQAELPFKSANDVVGEAEIAEAAQTLIRKIGAWFEKNHSTEGWHARELTNLARERDDWKATARGLEQNAKDVCRLKNAIANLAASECKEELAPRIERDRLQEQVRAMRDLIEKTAALLKAREGETLVQAAERVVGSLSESALLLERADMRRMLNPKDGESLVAACKRVTSLLVVAVNTADSAFNDSMTTEQEHAEEMFTG